jgi:hypothetical protein
MKPTSESSFSTTDVSFYMSSESESTDKSEGHDSEYEWKSNGAIP